MTQEWWQNNSLLPYLRLFYLFLWVYLCPVEWAQYTACTTQKPLNWQLIMSRRWCWLPMPTRAVSIAPFPTHGCPGSTILYPALNCLSCRDNDSGWLQRFTRLKDPLQAWLQCRDVKLQNDPLLNLSLQNWLKSKWVCLKKFYVHWVPVKYCPILCLTSSIQLYYSGVKHGRKRQWPTTPLNHFLFAVSALFH